MHELTTAVAGGFGSAAIIGVMGALSKYYLNSTYTPGINAAVAIYFIFGAFFTSTIECTAYVYGAEIWPTHLRSEGSTIAFASFFGNAVAYTGPVTMALATIGWKYYMVFVAVTVVSTVGIIFYFPEVRTTPQTLVIKEPANIVRRPWVSVWRKSTPSSETRSSSTCRTPWLPRTATLSPTTPSPRPLTKCNQ